MKDVDDVFNYFTLHSGRVSLINLHHLSSLFSFDSSDISKDYKLSSISLSLHFHSVISKLVMSLQVPEDERKFQEDLDLALAMSLSESNSVKTFKQPSLSNNPPNPTPDPHPTTSTRETAPTTASSQPGGNRGSSISSRFTSFIQGLFPSDPHQTNNTNTSRTCGRCGQPIRYGRYLTINNECFHADCFRCSSCGECMSERVSYYGTPPLPFHPACAQALILHEQDITGGGRGSGEVISNEALSSLLGGLNTTAPERGRGSRPTDTLGTARCHTCHELITFGQYVTSQNKMFHKDCFRCVACHNVITGQVRFHEEQPYHPTCAKELFNPHCTLCNGVIEGTYARHPFFSKEIYCYEHSTASPPLKTCYCCGRKEPLPVSRREGFIALPDGRTLCPHCSETIIMDSSEASDIYQHIVTFMQDSLHMPIPPDMRAVPILAVDSQAINENRAKSTIGNHTSDSSTTPTTRGLTLSTVGTVRHFNRDLSFLRPVPGSSNQYFVTNPYAFLQQQQQIFRIEEVRDVTAVLVLYGLPRDLFASILAHEATHVWLKLTKTIPYDLPPEVEEGLCQLIAYKYLLHLDEEIKKNNDKNKSSKSTANESDGVGDESDVAFYRYQIEEDPSLIYGEGFRAARKAEAAIGLDILVEYIAQNKTFPQT